MEITGKIIQILPEENSATDATNQWKKVGAVLETIETYPKKVYFELFNERIEQNPIKIGQNVHLSYSLESREYNGRWYTSVRGLSVTLA